MMSGSAEFDIIYCGDTFGVKWKNYNRCTQFPEDVAWCWILEGHSIEHRCPTVTRNPQYADPLIQIILYAGLDVMCIKVNHFHAP